MTRIVGKDFDFKGKLVSFDEAGEAIRFMFAGKVEVEVPNVGRGMAMTLLQVGLHGLENAVIDIVNGNIKLNQDMDPNKTKAQKEVQSQKNKLKSIPVGLSK